MHRSVGATLAAAMVLGAGLAATVPAVAAPSDVVTTSEFYAVAPGNTLAFVRATFGSNGTVVEKIDEPGTAQDFLELTYPTSTGEGGVSVAFSRRSSGTWYLTSKGASFHSEAVRTADKATEPEFNRIKRGNSIAFVRSAFGTAGTITSYSDSLGSANDRLSVAWPTADVDGRVLVDFGKNSAGTWTVDWRLADWDRHPVQTANKATEPEYNRVGIGRTLDHARTTFGSGGTVDYYVDDVYVEGDSLQVLWPTASSAGWVRLGLATDVHGVWEVANRRAYWARPAATTADVATEDELASLSRGDTLEEARSAFGTAGTVSYTADLPGPSRDGVEIGWYTGTPGEDVYLVFVKDSSGTWRINGTLAPWFTDRPSAREYAERHELS